MNPAVLQCMSCRSVLSDTLAYYITSDEEARTVSVRDARGVSVGTEDAVSSAGWDRGYSYRRLWCSFCRSSLGRLYSSTAMRHDTIRDAYTFDTGALVSYELGSLAAVPGRQGTGARQRHSDGGGWPRNEMQGPELARMPESRVQYDGTGDRANIRASSEALDGRSPVETAAKMVSHRLHGFARDEEVYAVKSAVSELDEHVYKLTTATNQATVAQRKLEAELANVSNNFQGLCGEHRAMEGKQSALEEALRNKSLKINSLVANMRDTDAELVKMENLFLIWEERFKRIEAVLPVAPLAPTVSKEAAVPPTEFRPQSPDVPIPGTADVPGTANVVDTSDKPISGDDSEVVEIGSRINRRRMRGRGGARGRKRGRSS
jgi:hypothetical protein